MNDITMADRPLWVWGVFFAVFLGVLVFDLNVINKKDHVVKIRESLKLSALYLVIALLFGIWVWIREGSANGGLFVTGYLVEQSLSMDNIFVISLVLNYFAVKKDVQHRVLFWGILGVIMLRGLMIGLGTEIISHFQWVLYLFAGFLVFTGVKMLFMDDDDDEHDLSNNAVVKFFKARLRVTDEFHGHDFVVKQKDPKTNKLLWYATPLLLALCVVEVVDIIFAVDSIPAILAITQDAFIVYTSNLFAIMGLRALYFTLSAMLDRFAYLKYALSLVLIFIGAKVFVVKMLHIEIHPAISLLITVGTLVAGGLFSLHKTKEGADGKGDSGADKKESKKDSKKDSKAA